MPGPNNSIMSEFDNTTDLSQNGTEPVENDTPMVPIIVSILNTLSVTIDAIAEFLASLVFAIIVACFVAVLFIILIVHIPKRWCTF